MKRITETQQDVYNFVKANPLSTNKKIFMGLNHSMHNIRCVTADLERMDMLEGYYKLGNIKNKLYKIKEVKE